MNTKTAKILCTINSGFYRDNADSFSQTRSAAWSGWSLCIDALVRNGLKLKQGPCACGQQEQGLELAVEQNSRKPDLAVLDLACGNLRFESFLDSAFPDTCFEFFAIDNCDVLVPQTPAVNFQCLDVLDALLCDDDTDNVNGDDNNTANINDRLTAPLCDLSVSFGFLHHVPMMTNRVKVLELLIRQTRSGGFIVVSLWQFLNNKKLAEKAKATHRKAQQELELSALDAGDYLLGWKDIPGQYRYCHSFSETEIEQLVAAIADKATLLSRFESDGRGDNLNCYLVLKVN